MIVRFFRVAMVAAFVFSGFEHPANLLAQVGPGSGPVGFGGLARWDSASPRAESSPQTRPRRWTLYFPPDWRHPAIIRPPVKVFLDPPYGWEDPFGRFPSPPPVDDASVPALAEPVVGVPTQPPREIPRPKVLELNPSTGQLEERTLEPTDRQPGVATDVGPAPPPADVAPKRQSPFHNLRRWDALSS